MAPKPSCWSSCARWQSPPAARPLRVPRPHRKTARSTPSCCRGAPPDAASRHPLRRRPHPVHRVCFWRPPDAQAPGATGDRPRHRRSRAAPRSPAPAAVSPLLLFPLAHGGVLRGIGGAAMVAAWRWRGPGAGDPVRIPPAGWVIFGAYGVWYLVNALAPESMADGITYHLGLPNEYLRLGGFSDHVTFYDLVPQGMEMLYTVAFALGRHAAARMVEFAFFLATAPLIFRTGRRLGASDLACLVAAVFYFCAPVAGITGSSSYNDAAGVFFLLAAFYLLLGDPRYLRVRNRFGSTTNAQAYPAGQTLGQTANFRQTAPEIHVSPGFAAHGFALSRRSLLPAGVLAGFCY